MSKERRLGIGLDALLGEPERRESFSPAPTNELELSTIEPNPFQPRLVFEDDGIRELADSIRQSGVLQPILVRHMNGQYQLVAGERRLRAARLAGLDRIPAVVREIDDGRMLELALVENLQRRDLNPMEKAKAFQRLMQHTGCTQDEVAKGVGLSRPSVANFLRLLDLPVEIQEAVSRGTISMGHARTLLGTANTLLQKKLLLRVIEEDLSVRALERIIAGTSPTRLQIKPTTSKDPYIQDLERRMADFFGTRVVVNQKARGGTLTVEWYSDDQFTGIIQKLGV